MSRSISTILLAVLLSACASRPKANSEIQFKADLTLAFGSCNRQDSVNRLWDDVLDTDPDLWIWGGDNIYADTDDIPLMQAMYATQRKEKGYRKIRQRIPIIGTWDDHDYGLGDGGVEFHKKGESQEAFLNFMEVPSDSPRRTRQGIYSAHVLGTALGKVKILVLDTRYFRTALTPSESEKKRYEPNSYGQGTVLGAEQWKWLEEELKNSDADFHLLVSSIQFLSDKHGFECWGNFPHEVDRLKELLVSTGAQNTLILSGDRHISEFSKSKVEGLPFPLIDFTSSGLTHTYSDFAGEPNPYRVGNVISKINFGLVQFNFLEREVRLQIIGDGGLIYQELRQSY